VQHFLITRLIGLLGGCLLSCLLVFSGGRELSRRAPTDQLAFVRGTAGGSAAGIYLLDVNRQIAQRILRQPMPAGNSQLYWSPDGERLAFAAPQPQKTPRENHQGIYVVNFNGADGHWVTPDDGLYTSPAWSHDSQYLVYSGIEGLFVVRYDSRAARLLKVIGATPAWSRDDRQILVIAFDPSPERRFRVHAVDADGRHYRPLSQTQAANFPPAVAPDGGQIVFVSAGDANARTVAGRLSQDIYLVDWNGRERRLTGDLDNSALPTWLPDGKRLVYVSTSQVSPFRMRLYEVQLATGSQRLLAELPQNASWPAWSADVQTLAFEVRQVNARWGIDREIYVMRADGGGLRQLTHTGLNYAPAWRPCPAGTCG
jgi:Tol biopolymer transport system component